MFAEPFDKGKEELCVTPSTMTVKVPVGVAVLEPEAEATVMVMTSFAPGVGVLVTAESVVVVATGDEEVAPGQASNKLSKSTEPRPEAWS
jgi:hypothetical protein